MIQTENGEIELKKDRRTILVYGLALLLALVAFLVIYRLGDVTKFVEGTEVVYEGVVVDSAGAGITLIDSPFYRKVDPRDYIGLQLADGSGLCIYTASLNAPDHKKYLFSTGIRPGDLVRITAAEEIGTGLMIVQGSEVITCRDYFLDYVSEEIQLRELPAAAGYTSADDHTVTSIRYQDIGADVSRSIIQQAANDAYMWRELPLTQNLSEALYGNNPVLTDEAAALLPEIENGWWYFRTHDDDTYGDQQNYSLVSSNFTAAIYDADTDTLYYIEIDK